MMPPFVPRPRETLAEKCARLLSECREEIARRKGVGRFIEATQQKDESK